MNRAISRLRAPCALLAPLLALTACSGAGGGYPSLAIRDVERVSGTAQPVQPQVEPSPAPPVSKDINQQVARLTAQARQAHAEFESRSTSAARTVAAARGLRAPADGWVESQVALASLQALRSTAMVALADLDQLFADDRLAFSGELSPTAQTLKQARDQIGAWVDDENRTIARLASQLAS